MRSLLDRPLFIVALPALVGLLFLLAVSIFVYGHAFRPGLYAETLLVLYMSALLLRFQRNQLRGAIATTLLLLVLYGACLVKYVVLREAFGWTDLVSLRELFFVLSPLERVALVAAVGVPLVLYVTNLARPRSLPAAVLLMPLAAYVSGTAIVPSSVYGTFETLRSKSLIVELEPWRDGPLWVLLRQAAREAAVREFLAAPMPEDETLLSRRARALASLPPPQRSVHIIMLESFVDPLHFRSLHCPADPVDPRFRRWIDEGQSIAMAATFAGRSARSEFEVLCGVPTFERLGLDFMALRGASVPCLPNLLRNSGYLTISSSSGPPTFFNHAVAHAAVGFERSYFEGDFVVTPETMDGNFISDEAYYAQMLKRVLPAVNERRPLFNFVLTWAGHYPFDLNPRRRLPCSGDTPAGKVANAAHYASVAAADLVERIEAHDPEALIVVMSDHLPTLGLADAGYREADYRLGFRGGDVPPFWADGNPSWLESRATTLIARRARRPVSLGIIPHYLVTEAVLDLVTDGGYCRATECYRSLPILERPRGERPVFTTREVFPRTICDEVSDHDNQHCRDAEQLHGKLELEYEALLRAGLRPSLSPTNSSSASHRSP